MIFADGCPGGETPDQIGHRVDRVISKVRATNGNVALFAHGHFFRVLVARWLGFRVLDGAHFLLEPATLNILGYYEGIPAVKRWNLPIS
jgi:probable phosphoglycerate mutase